MLRIACINVGYGESILFQCDRTSLPPYTMLLDCGGDGAAEFPRGGARIRAGEYLARKGISRLDTLVASHVHENHISGYFHKIDQLPVGMLWGVFFPDPAWPALSSVIAADASAHKFLRALNDYRRICLRLRAVGAPLRMLSLSQESLAVCEGLCADVYGPPPAGAHAFQQKLRKLYLTRDLPLQQALLRELDAEMNDNSIILRLHYRGRKILLAGDTGLDGYAALLRRPECLRADIFKVGRHGGIDSLSPELLRAVDPEALLICAPSDRRQGSIHPDILGMAQRYGEERGRPVRLLFSDVPDLPPYTDRMQAHSAVTITIGDDGEISCGEEIFHPI